MRSLIVNFITIAAGSLILAASRIFGFWSPLLMVLVVVTVVCLQAIFFTQDIKEGYKIRFGNTRVSKQADISAMATIKEIADDDYHLRHRRMEFRRLNVTYSFTTYTGENITLSEKIFVARHSKKTPFKIGMQIPVHYVKSSPKIATIDTVESRNRHIKSAGLARLAKINSFFGIGRKNLDNGFYDRFYDDPF